MKKLAAGESRTSVESKRLKTSVWIEVGLMKEKEREEEREDGVHIVAD